MKTRERSEHQPQRRAVRRSRRRLGAIRGRNVRAADLQEKPTKRVRLEKISKTVVSAGSTKTAALKRTSRRAERAIGLSERQRAKQSARHYCVWHASWAQPGLSGRIG